MPSSEQHLNSTPLNQLFLLIQWKSKNFSSVKRMMHFNTTNKCKCNSRQIGNIKFRNNLVIRQIRHKTLTKVKRRSFKVSAAVPQIFPRTRRHKYHRTLSQTTRNKSYLLEGKSPGKESTFPTNQITAARLHGMRERPGNPPQCTLPTYLPAPQYFCFDSYPVPGEEIDHKMYHYAAESRKEKEMREQFLVQCSMLAATSISFKDENVFADNECRFDCTFKLFIIFAFLCYVSKQILYSMCNY